MYAELTLYFGLCDNHSGFGEGRFDSKGSEYSIRRYNAGLTVVLQRLTWASEGRKWAIKLGYEHFVENDQEAATLIQYAEKNMRKAYGVIELVDSCHGMIRFYRKIRFEGVSPEQKDVLIAKFKESGFTPTVDKHSLYGLKERELEIERDKRWNEALKFFD